MRPSSLQRSAALAILAAASAACTALAGLETIEYVDAPDARGGETGSEVDGSITPDASTADAPVTDGDASAPTGCKLVDAEFCDDFDNADPLSARWSAFVGPDGVGSLAVSNVLSRSAPSSLRGESLANDSSAPINFGVNKALPSFKGEIFIAFDILFRVAPTNGVFVVSSGLTPTYGNNNNAVNPMIAAFPDGDGGVEVTAFNLVFTPGRGLILGTLPVNKWAHVEGRVRRDADPSTTTEQFQLEGNPMMSKQIPTEAPTAAPSVTVGMNSGGTIMEVFFDNVVIDTR